jgi:hypothetical protein
VQDRVACHDLLPVGKAIQYRTAVPATAGRKRRRGRPESRLIGIDEIVPSLTAKGLTTGGAPGDLLVPWSAALVAGSSGGGCGVMRSSLLTES